MPGKTLLQTAGTRHVLFCLFCLAFLAASGCKPARTGDADNVPQGPADQATVVSTGARRADPGYIQYLERLSMAGSQVELARVVSGSQLSWLRPAANPFPDPLLTLADTWLSVNPLVTLPETKRSVFSSLASPRYWQIFGRSRLNGLYIAPANGSGALWAYNRKASAKGDDVIQYTFSEAAGTEDDYFRLLQSANSNRKLLGLELTPAATGLGPDFFLAARFHRQFSGVYCMVELPKQLWSALPEVPDQWRGAPLSEEQTAALASQKLLPPAMAQDFLPTGKEGGWAVTGEIYGVDGLMRRWAYRYYGSPDRPVLNWEDPSAGARRILSGSAIRNVGILGSALIGMRLNGLYGLDAAAPGSRPRFTPTPADEAAVAVSREVRRYGGWAWLKDDIPLSLVRDLMAEGPDFFQDHIFSPGIEHAMLTGSTALLDTMVDEALVLGLDMRRFVHATAGEQGINYDLPHLGDVAAGNTEASLLRPAQADELRRNTLKEAMNVVYAANVSSPRGDDKPPLRGKDLYTTPAGIAALALGAGNAHSVAESMEPLVREGHFLQVFVRAMLPGLFMISGQDLTGALPLSWHAMADTAEGWDLALTSRGAHAYTQSVPDSAVTALGVPKARTIYSTPDVQILEEDSFAARLAEALAIRTSYAMANGTFYGRFETTAPGCFAFAVVLPTDGHAQPGDLAVQTVATVDQTVATANQAPVAARQEAVVSDSASSRKGTAAERLKQRHEETKRLRGELEYRIVTVPAVPGKTQTGDAAMIVVANFSRETVRQVLNLHHDPVLQRIRQKGEPKLLTKGKSGHEIQMSHGEQTVTLTLGPWQCAAVLVGKP